jgi:Tripartite ATP-independent periplasmic transporter, DctM component
MTIAIFLGSLLAAMALGIPIAFSLLLCGAALMWHMNMFDAQILAQNLIEGSNSFPLLAVPFFMLAGEVMNAGGLSRRIVNFAMALVGHIKGGLGYVTIVAAVIMASLSGSAVADAAALTALLLPMMVAAGLDCLCWHHCPSHSTKYWLCNFWCGGWCFHHQVVHGRHFPWHHVGSCVVVHMVVLGTQRSGDTTTTQKSL